MQPGMSSGFRDWFTALEHEGFGVEVRDVKSPRALADQENAA
jgi:hypothetical protein